MLKRWFIPVVLLMAIVASIALTSASLAKKSTDIRLIVDGETVGDSEGSILIMDGVALGPLRSIAEALGAKVQWIAVDNRIVIAKGDTKIEVAHNDNMGLVNGKSIRLDAPLTLINGKTMIPVRWISETFGAKVIWDARAETVYIDYMANTLPVVGSYSKLVALLKESQASRNRIFGDLIDFSTTTVTESAADSAASSPQAKSIAGADYSATNTQVQGVDEGDVVKTDGRYIYQVNQQKVIIAEAYPSEQMKVISTVKFEADEKFNPQEIYVDKKHLVVIGNVYYQHDVIQPYENKKQKMIAPPHYGTDMMMAKVYDISDKSSVKKIREVELEGYYAASRKIGSSLYFVTNKHLDYYYIMQRDDTTEAGEAPAPLYRDSLKSEKPVTIGYDKIRYFPGSTVEPNYLLIAGLDLNEPNQEMSVSSYLGSGQNIYASQNHLYVAVTQYEEIDARTLKKGDGPAIAVVGPEPMQMKTAIYKFALENGVPKYSGKGEVPGTILNQFSMDEHDEHFRIATTKGDIWRTDEFTSKNNVYILDSKLNRAGSLEDIAPGERIYSVRFMGDRGYMVTFKTVDPLFVIDLKEPNAPKILGALKIPGYSDYLHPYDENHIIGFGKDAVEWTDKDAQGISRGTAAFYQGMKIALFDVTDVSNPIEKFKTNIGDRGTDSELLRNHRALLFSKEKNVLAFPITVMEKNKENEQDKISDITAYGQLSFQGAYVYHIDLNQGFKLRGKLTHLSEEDMQKAGDHWYDSNKNIERLLYINDTLYTLSKHMMKAYELDNLEEKNSLNLQP